VTDDIPIADPDPGPGAVPPEIAQESGAPIIQPMLMASVVAAIIVMIAIGAFVASF
jgi:hypothetical protein